MTNAQHYLSGRSIVTRLWLSWSIRDHTCSRVHRVCSVSARCEHVHRESDFFEGKVARDLPFRIRESIYLRAPVRMSILLGTIRRSVGAGRETRVLPSASLGTARCASRNPRVGMKATSRHLRPPATLPVRRGACTFAYNRDALHYTRTAGCYVLLCIRDRQANRSQNKSTDIRIVWFQKIIFKKFFR